VVSEKDGGEALVVVDREAALAALDDDLDLLQELAELFLAEAPELIDEIRSSVNEGNSMRLRQTAHTLKGAASNFRARATVSAALELERMGHEEDLGGAERALEALVREFDRLRPELEKLAGA